MESKPQNPEFRINPENFHPCIDSVNFFILWSFRLLGSRRKKNIAYKSARGLRVDAFPLILIKDSITQSLLLSSITYATPNKGTII